MMNRSWSRNDPQPARLGVILAVALFCGLAPEPAVACTCGSNPSVEQAREDATVVFVGRVVQETLWHDSGETLESGSSFDFAVERIWKGRSQRTLTVRTFLAGGNCGYPFQSGQQYLVYAYEYEGHLYTSICQRTCSLGEAKLDLIVLGNGRMPGRDPQRAEPFGAILLAAVTLVGGCLVWIRQHKRVSLASSELSSGRVGLRFSLRAMFGALLLSGLTLAVVTQVPRAAIAILLLSVLVLLPNTLAAALQTLLAACGLVPKRDATRTDGPARSTAAQRISYLHWLGLCLDRGRLSIRSSAVAALVTTALLVALWPLICLAGMLVAAVAVWPLEHLKFLFRIEIWFRLFDAAEWQRAWHWEAWSIARWWALFATLTGLWCIGTGIVCGQAPAGCGRRLLAFAPWIMFLEMLLLAGTFLQLPSSVPEPRSLFVADIYAWNDWRWNAWQDSGWLVRGALPTFLAGFSFFRAVLDWRRSWALIGAVGLVPMGLLLSIAWSVLYMQVFWD